MNAIEKPTSKYVLRPDDMESYSPANHTGTKNTRLVSAAINGAHACLPCG